MKIATVDQPEESEEEETLEQEQLDFLTFGGQDTDHKAAMQRVEPKVVRVQVGNRQFTQEGKLVSEENVMAFSLYCSYVKQINNYKKAEKPKDPIQVLKEIDSNARVIMVNERECSASQPVKVWMRINNQLAKPSVHIVSDRALRTPIAINWKHESNNIDSRL